ncbi:MAG TPA: nucleotidyltransferase domain-containing protein [bacterium]|nr:nucleotidyltransferase domain-containing protein [bacterium]
MNDKTQPIWAVTEEKIREAVQRIAEIANPMEIICFGSQARGNANNNSDLDLMVVLEHVSDKVQESVRLRRALSGLIMGVDILVVDKARFDYWRDTPGNVYYEAVQDGKTVYQAG